MFSRRQWLISSSSVHSSRRSVDSSASGEVDVKIEEERGEKEEEEEEEVEVERGIEDRGDDAIGKDRGRQVIISRDQITWTETLVHHFPSHFHPSFFGRFLVKPTKLCH
jgi:hypothetical protein